MAIELEVGFGVAAAAGIQKLVSDPRDRLASSRDAIPRGCGRYL